MNPHMVRLFASICAQTIISVIAAGCGDDDHLRATATPTPTASARATPRPTPITAAILAGVFDVEGTGFVVAVIEAPSDALEPLRIRLLDGLDDFALTGRVDADGHVTVDGSGILEGDVFSHATADLLATIEDDEIVLAGTLAFEHGPPVEVRLTRATAGNHPAAGTYDLRFDDSPSVIARDVPPMRCPCPSHVRVALHLATDGVASMDGGDDLGAGNRIVGTLLGGPCYFSPTDRVVCETRYVAGDLNVRLTLVGDYLGGEHTRMGGFIQTPFIDESGWTADRDDAAIPMPPS